MTKSVGIATLVLAMALAAGAIAAPVAEAVNPLYYLGESMIGGEKEAVEGEATTELEAGEGQTL